MADGKAIFIRGKEYALLLTVDAKTQDIPMAQLANGLEVECFFFLDKIPYTAIYFFHPGMPRTNNIIEGIIRLLSRKIDDTDGFEFFETAWNSIRLLIMNYRFHPFSCSRIKDHNGLSPLELAGVNISNLNRVEFSQKEFTINTN